jgi:hypothetical protein
MIPRGRPSPNTVYAARIFEILAQITIATSHTLKRYAKVWQNNL